jgi:two-component system, OmpR family, response regulator MprA
MSRVLVVDDDRGIREMVRAILELEGYEVDAAGSGAQALNVLLAAREPRVVLMDVMMPDLTGIEVCERLHAAGAPVARHQVALMTAGVLEDEDCPSPARTILRKPFELDALLRLVACMAQEVACGHLTRTRAGEAAQLATA